MTSLNKKNLTVQIIACLILSSATLLVYYPPSDKEFINFDINVYILDNIFVNSGLSLRNVKWAFGATLQEHWHPLTWLSHMLDCEIFGLNPWGHHFVNSIIHMFNVLLVFFAFKRMTGAFYRSMLVAAFFALHPLHVESIAWTVGRKDLLSMFFFLLTIHAYISFTEKSNLFSYFFAIALFSLGLMSKSMIVTLPCILLLLDLWPLGRFKNDTPNFFLHGKIFRIFKPTQKIYRSVYLVIEKIPFFFVSVMTGLLLLFIHERRIFYKDWEPIPFGERTIHALIAYMNYIGKILWPRNLALPYPPFTDVSEWEFIFALVFLLSLSAMVISLRRRYPFFFVGWFWFLGTLVPVIGIINTGPGVMADRYCYIPNIGIYVMLVWGFYEIFKNAKFREYLFAIVSALFIVILTAFSTEQVRVWQNSTTLFSHTLKITRNNEKAHINLAATLAKKGRFDEALTHFSQALKLRPDSWKVLSNIGLVHFWKRNYVESEKYFVKTLQLNPKNEKANNYLGVIYSEKGALDKAILYLSRAVELNPNYADAHVNLGLTLIKKGDLNSAINHFYKAIDINPNNEKAYFFLGEAYGRTNDFTMALIYYKKALSINPKYIPAYKRILELNQKHENISMHDDL